MTDTDQEKEDAVLRQMLKTPPRPHNPTGLTPLKTKKAKKHRKSPAREDQNEVTQTEGNPSPR